MRMPADMADLLRTWLQSQGHDACADSLPDDYKTRLPLTLLRTVGGQHAWPITDVHRIGVDVYGTTIDAALAESREVFGTLDTINEDHPVIGGTPTYRVEFGGLPQPADDDLHMDAPMVTFLIQVTARSLEE